MYIFLPAFPIPFFKEFYMIISLRNQVFGQLLRTIPGGVREAWS